MKRIFWIAVLLAAHHMHAMEMGSAPEQNTKEKTTNEREGGAPSFAASRAKDHALQKTIEHGEVVMKNAHGERIAHWVPGYGFLPVSRSFNAARFN